MLPLVAAELVTVPVPKTEFEPVFPFVLPDLATAPAPTVTV
jgi:hypothetical protein